VARFVEGKGIRFKGRIYPTWPLLSKALLKDGQKPNKWIEKNQNKARKAFSIGLNENRVPVLVTDKEKPVGQALRDEAAIVDAGEMIEDLVRSYFKDFNFDGAAERTFIQDIKDDVGGQTDSDIIVANMLGHDEINLLFPGFSDLAGAGVITASGVAAGAAYITWRNEVQETHRKYFGTSMDREQLGQVAAGAVTGRASAAFLEHYYSFINSVGEEYELRHGEAASKERLDQMFETGKSAARWGMELQGESYIAANRGDIQGTAGAFNFGAGLAGPGAFSEEELKALGEQEAGITTELGLDMQRRVATATQRMSRIWQGQSVQGTVSLPGGATRGAPGSRVDVGA